MPEALKGEKRYYAQGMGYTQLYMRQRPGGKEGEMEQKAMQFAHYPAGTVRHAVSGVIVEQHHFCQYATSDALEQAELEKTIKKAQELGGSVVMLEDEFLKTVAALRLRMEPGAAEAMIDHNNSLMARIQQLEAKERLSVGGKGHGEAAGMPAPSTRTFGNRIDPDDASDDLPTEQEQEPEREETPTPAAESVASAVSKAKASKPAPPVKTAIRK